MKIFKIPLLAFTYFVFISISSPVSATEIQHSVVFKNGIKIDTAIAQDGKIYSIIKLSDCSLLSNGGEPQIPVKKN